MPRLDYDTLVRSMDPTAPGWSLLLVTKSDTVAIKDASSNPVVSRALLVNQDTTAKLTMADGTVVASVPLQKGYNPLRVRQVWSTGTDVVSVYAVY